MNVVGRIDSLWRYPVKSMRGELLKQAFVGFGGVYGDRCYAFLDSAAQVGFPYLTARQKEEMLLYKPTYRDAAKMLQPPNIAEAAALNSTPIYPDAAGFMIDVETPSRNLLAIDDPALLTNLRDGLRDQHQLTLLRSQRALTDCQPISLLSLETVRQLSQEVGASLDKRSFRMNIYVELQSPEGFGENKLVGHRVAIGAKVVVAILDRDPRCKMITLDPDTAKANPEVMRRLARDHDGKAGVYGAVLVEGAIYPGDTIHLL